MLILLEPLEKYMKNFQQQMRVKTLGKNILRVFGLGNFLGYDLPTGRPGRIPGKEYYDKWYGDNRWGFLLYNL